MNLQSGIIIKSIGDDPVFADAVIFLSEVNAGGAVGFVVNKPFFRKLNELEEFKNAPGFTLYDGGPVDREHLFLMHRQPALIPGGTEITNGIFMGGDINEAISCLHNHKITSADLKIFIGYCGWNANELQTEIQDGSWVIADDSPNIFSL